MTGHSLKYLAKKAEDEEKLAKKRKERDEEFEAQANSKRQRMIVDEAKKGVEDDWKYQKTLFNGLTNMAVGNAIIHENLYPGQGRELLDTTTTELEELYKKAEAEVEEKRKAIEEVYREAKAKAGAKAEVK